MKSEIEFLTIEDVLAIHEAQIKKFGGASGLRDRSLLEAAVAMPEASFGGEFLHSDIFEMAAAYAFHISQNRPFFDGNKRAGLLSALIFLDINGIAIDSPSNDLYEAMMRIANGKLDKAGFANTLRTLTTAPSQN